MLKTITLKTRWLNDIKRGTVLYFIKTHEMLSQVYSDKLCMYNGIPRDPQ